MMPRVWRPAKPIPSHTHPPVLQSQPNCSSADLGRVPLCRAHDPILSIDGVSGNPGAVYSLVTGTCWKSMTSHKGLSRRCGRVGEEGPEPEIEATHRRSDYLGTELGQGH